jgi:signal transduction histidine kinase
MMANLIKNAAEASSEGEQITISLKNSDFAEIRIHNKGSVPEEIRDTFFDKYVTSGKSGGTGLGTYSASLISKVLGGSIGLDTSDEDGTTISLRLKTRSR